MQKSNLNFELYVDSQPCPIELAFPLFQCEPFSGGHKYYCIISGEQISNRFANVPLGKSTVSEEDAKLLFSILGSYWDLFTKDNVDISQQQYFLNNVEEIDFNNEQLKFSGVCSKVTRGDVRLLIPLSKMDTERAEAAVAAGYPTVAPILPELLEWLQDMNWLVAEILAPFLASIGSPLIPHIRNILATDDEVWKYWIIRRIIRESREVAEAIRGELERIAYSPTKSEAEEELDEESKLILKEYGW